MVTLMKQSNHRWPAEWEAHQAYFTAWPADASLWQDDLHEAQTSVRALVRAITSPAAGHASADGSPERVELLAPQDAHAELLEAFEGLAVRLHNIPYGDIWLRDTGPIFVKDTTHNTPRALCFDFNGWGGKYILDHDAEVAHRVATASGTEAVRYPFILEGGAVEANGEGLLITTRACLLNPNRHVTDQAVMEAHLREALGAQSILWLEHGLANDHTDGHIDNLVRFVAPNRVVCMLPRQNSDPNAHVLRQIHASLKQFQDLRGGHLEVIDVPSPGRVENVDGDLMPASYMNFLISNQALIIPLYKTAYDEQTLQIFTELFPQKRVVGIACNHLLNGGGALHCITQQHPR